MDNKLIEFINDDDGYFAWLMSHPSGYVLNVRCVADPGYVVLHSATCGMISSRKRLEGAYTCRGFRKWCSNDLVTLRDAAILEGRRDGTFSKKCRLCFASEISTAL